MPQSELHAYVGNTDCGSNGEGPSILGLDDTRIAKRYKSAILFVADKPFLAFLHKE